MRTIIIILIIIAAIVALFFFGKSRIPDMLANNLSKKLGVAVSIDSMNFIFVSLVISESFSLNFALVLVSDNLLMKSSSLSSVFSAAFSAFLVKFSFLR